MGFFDTIWAYATSGIVGWIIVVGIAYFLLTKYVVKKGTLFIKNRRTEMIVLLIIGVLVTGAFSVSNLFSVGGGSPTGQATNTAGLNCQQPGGGNTNSVLINARNSINTGVQDYMTATAVLVYADGGESASSALTGGTKQYVTFASAPCKTGDIYLLSSTTQNGMKQSFDSYSLTKNYDLQGTNSSRLAGSIYNSAFSSIMDGAGQYTPNTTQQTMGQGSTLAGYLDVQANETIGQYGSTDGGIVWAIDVVRTDFAVTDVSLTSSDITLTPIDCGSVANLITAYSADVCYKSSAIKSTNGVVRIRYNFQSNLANPSASNDLVVYAEDLNYARDTDGKIKLMVKDGSGADIGESQFSATFDLG